MIQDLRRPLHLLLHPRDFHPLVWFGWTATHLALVSLLVMAILVASEEVYPSSVRLDVSAVVLKKVWVRPLLVPRSVTVRPEDVQRGYVDVADSTVLAVRNNSEDGFELDVEFEPGLVARADVRGLGVPASIGPGGGFLSQRGLYREETRIELRWRLYLAPGVAAGTYPWPVQMHVQAG